MHTSFSCCSREGYSQPLDTCPPRGMWTLLCAVQAHEGQNKGRGDTYAYIQHTSTHLRVICRHLAHGGPLPTHSSLLLPVAKSRKKPSAARPPRVLGLLLLRPTRLSPRLDTSYRPASHDDGGGLVRIPAGESFRRRLSEPRREAQAGGVARKRAYGEPHTSLGCCRHNGVWV